MKSRRKRHRHEMKRRCRVLLNRRFLRELLPPNPLINLTLAFYVSSRCLVLSCQRFALCGSPTMIPRTHSLPLCERYGKLEAPRSCDGALCRFGDCFVIVVVISARNVDQLFHIQEQEFHFPQPRTYALFSPKTNPRNWSTDRGRWVGLCARRSCDEPQVNRTKHVMHLTWHNSTTSVGKLTVWREREKNVSFERESQKKRQRRGTCSCVLNI